jgi:hypothetical protein
MMMKNSKTPFLLKILMGTRNNFTEEIDSLGTRSEKGSPALL